MSGLIAQVVAQLNSAIKDLDTLAIQAIRAQADIEQATGYFAAGGKGSSHPKIQAALTDSRTSAAKAGRLGRLNSDAADHLADYVNAIAPGSATGRTAAGVASPSGEDLLRDSEERELARKNVGTFLKRAVRNADELQDQAASATQAVQQTAKVVRNPSGPAGSHSTGTATPSTPDPTPRSKIDAPDAAGNLVVIGLLAGVAIHRITAIVKKNIPRIRKRGHDETG
ncbi:hypothetical protein GCM10011608_37870 [Micromonospora sonchi]|uniref:Uncharacterized protein n=1 Tax=Micromonospora sonchi TaxID=1763543 RepID=A0A917U226_9ACTN|nr:hypothetical protein [Micromonospora sonchi]GGM49332.1 hypothetical protein GCM10011608_37870 [Micromonospora sonchi]